MFFVFTKGTHVFDKGNSGFQNQPEIHFEDLVVSNVHQQTEAKQKP